MDETVLFSSPNWFKASGLVVSSDGWILYGGPSKSLCVLEPLPPKNDDDQQQKYHSLVIPRSHGEKIVSLDISPEWPAKRAIVTGAADGSVKQWNLKHINNKLTAQTTHSHEIHRNEKEEVAGVGYSTDTYVMTVGSFGNLVKWNVNSNVVKHFNTLKTFKPTCLKCSPHLPFHVAIGTKQGIIFILDLNDASKILCKVRGHDEEIYTLSWCPQYEVEVRKTLKKGAASRMEAIRASTNNESAIEAASNNMSLCHDQSQETSQLTATDLDETEVPEDDMFDIYKDHEPDEFGHKKYQPEDIYVKVKSETKQELNYLAECLKLKNDIIKRKSEGEQTIQSLVEAMDKTQLNTDTTDKPHTTVGDGHKTELSENFDTEITEEQSTASVHIHRHLLASIGKQGSVKIWSKTGKLVASGFVQGGNKQKGNSVICVALLWYKADTILVADGRGVLSECNPFHIDCKNSLEWKRVHNLHIRSLYCIASGAPKKQEPGDNTDWPVWTASQDRKIIQYSLKDNKPLAIHATCGGYVYTIAPCPYDAYKIAVSVGDGAVRVWQASDSLDDTLPFVGGDVISYWQNVLGKVLTVAWHPTHENLLAFGTAEARVGVIDTSGRVERGARALPPALGSGVYALTWAAGKLYACGGGQLVSYQTNKPHQEAKSIPVVVEGKEWRISEVVWTEQALVVGALDGAVAVLQPQSPHQPRAHAYPFTKVIHHIEWHPEQVSTSNEESPYKNQMAVCSMEKNIAILEFNEKDGKASLSLVRTLVGHRGAVNRVCWSPHHEARLLSTSQDNTVRIWDTVGGACTSIYFGHEASTLCGAWSPDPALPDCVLTGGVDCCVRLWDTKLYPYDEKAEAELSRVPDKKKKQNKKVAQEDVKEAKTEDNTVAEAEAKRTRASKKFLLPITYRQLMSGSINGCRQLFEKHLEKLRTQVTNGVSLPANAEANEQKSEINQNKESRNFDCDFIKIFGNTNDVNDLLDMEQARHEESGCHEAWIVLALVRGDMASAVTYAAQRDALGPYLLSLVPCVSYKYWKDATQLYLAQMERLAARGEVEKPIDTCHWGGVTYRRLVSLLAVHELAAAIELLASHGLHKEAYALCRARHSASLAEEALRRWAEHERFATHYTAAAACYLALGEVAEAAATLGRSSREEHLQLAAEMARFLGQNTYAAHVENKGEKIRTERESNSEAQFGSLPTKVELLTEILKNTLALETEYEIVDKNICKTEATEAE